MCAQRVLLCMPKDVICIPSLQSTIYAFVKCGENPQINRDTDIHIIRTCTHALIHASFLTLENASSVFSVKYRLSPKSPSLIWLSLVSMMLAGFKSRCMIRCLCMYCKPSESSLAYFQICLSLKPVRMHSQVLIRVSLRCYVYAREEHYPQ